YVFTCTDTGIGMSEEFLSHIFEEFSREETSAKNEVLGTGLGLPIVKSIIELMEGTIQVESKQNIGTKITITLPFYIAEKKDVYGKQETKMPSLSKENPRRILLAEDNALNAEIALELLKGAGFLVEHAADGQACVDMLSHAEDGYYDLILMDVQMPILNGYETTKKIRQMEDRKKAEIPILAMTANAFSEDRQAALEAGMNDHVAKPIDMNVLLRVMMKYL
ncbi:response regulator, partial [Anaerotignum faecicola]